MRVFYVISFRKPLLFHDATFLVSRTVDEDVSFVWRISEKAKFERSWSAFVDVRAVRTYSPVVRNLGKRVVQGTEISLNRDSDRNRQPSSPFIVDSKSELLVS